MMDPESLWTGCRIMARAMAHEPDRWLERIDELESVVNQRPPEYSRMIELLLGLVKEERDALDVLGQPLTINTSKPPMPLISALISALNSAVASNGSNAVPFLKRALEDEPKASPRRLWLLTTLADCGSPDLAEFFARLSIDELVAPMTGHFENTVKSFRKAGKDYQPSESGIRIAAQQFLSSIKSRYGASPER